jgi:hypothetical protein
MPSYTTVRRWLREHDEFRLSYAQAREAQADYYAEQIIELADASRKGKKIELRELGWECTACGKAVKWNHGWIHLDDSPPCEGAKAKQVSQQTTITGDMVERTKIQIDARKWYASKLAPKKYGDKVALTGPNDTPLIPEPLDLSKLSLAELKNLRDLAAKAKAAPDAAPK